MSSQSNAGFILYKVLKTGESKEPIYYTSKVECYYKGTFIDGTVFDDKSFEAGVPAELTVSDMVDGFATALQNMHQEIVGRFGFLNRWDTVRLEGVLREVS